MKVSLFLELPCPRPWSEGTEHKLFQDALELADLADRVGIHALWATEHHFMEEYCHSSAPEVWLAAVTQRTRDIRIGLGIVQMPPLMTHPVKVAEKVATLDLISNGRVEWGTGEAGAVVELDGFRVDPGKKRAMWDEALRVAVRCMTDTPFTGHEGEYVSIPPRNVVPKPLQKPHPPLWVACTQPATITLAAERGLGALRFAFEGPDGFKAVVDHYYETLHSAVPMGKAVNANISTSLGDLLLRDTDDQAQARLGSNGGWFAFGIAHYFVEEDHQPGRTDLWGRFQEHKQSEADGTFREADHPEAWNRALRGINNPDISGVAGTETLRQRLRRFERTGVDQVMFTLPAVAHEINMESLERLGKDVLPEFAERDIDAQAAKAERMHPIIEAAMRRRVDDAPPLDEDYKFGGLPRAWDTGEVASATFDAFKHAQEVRRQA
jgi:alkanesulfonate monooxygenase SsuD/methylene tetrahydromethanopterin reductase-like flavin-dependent oxidoreductase (luciferase family)